MKGIASRAIFLVKYKKLQIKPAVQSIGCWCRKEEAQLNDPANKEEEGWLGLEKLQQPIQVRKDYKTNIEESWILESNNSFVA